jgi:hypothetical protein
MKRFLVVLGTGVGIGYVLGSRAGRAPYERLEAKVKAVSGRDDVRAATESAAHAVSDLTDRAVSAGADTVESVAATSDEAFGDRSNSYERSSSAR